MAPTSASDTEYHEESGLYQAVERTLEARMEYNHSNRNTDAFYQSCLTFRVGSERPYAHPIRIPRGHLFSNSGLIVSDGIITHANFKDFGTSNAVPPSDVYAVNSVEDFESREIISPERETYNEFRIISPQYFGLFHFNYIFNDFSIGEISSYGTSHNLQIANLSSNNPESIPFNGENLTIDALLERIIDSN